MKEGKGDHIAQRHSMPFFRSTQERGMVIPVSDFLILDILPSVKKMMWEDNQ
jgi:hypothetical protein